VDLRGLRGRSRVHVIPYWLNDPVETRERAGSHVETLAPLQEADIPLPTIGSRGNMTADREKAEHDHPLTAPRAHEAVAWVTRQLGCGDPPLGEVDRPVSVIAMQMVEMPIDEVIDVSTMRHGCPHPGPFTCPGS